MSKTPQEAIEALVSAAQNAVTNKQSHYKARNGRLVTIEGDDGERMWLVSLEDMNDIEQALVAADAARAQEADAEPDGDIAKQRFKLWFFRDILDEHRLKLLALFDFPTDDKIGQTHGFQKRALHHILSALAGGEA